VDTFVSEKNRLLEVVINNVFVSRIRICFWKLQVQDTVHSKIRIVLISVPQLLFLQGNSRPEIIAQLIKGKFMVGIREAVKVSNYADKTVTCQFGFRRRFKIV
jgi:hypothetical protein